MLLLTSPRALRLPMPPIFIPEDGPMKRETAGEKRARCKHHRQRHSQTHSPSRPQATASPPGSAGLHPHKAGQALAASGPGCDPIRSDPRSCLAAPSPRASPAATGRCGQGNGVRGRGTRGRLGRRPAPALLRRRPLSEPGSSRCSASCPAAKDEPLAAPRAARPRGSWPRQHGAGRTRPPTQSLLHCQIALPRLPICFAGKQPGSAAGKPAEPGKGPGCWGPLASPRPGRAATPLLELTRLGLPTAPLPRTSPAQTRSPQRVPTGLPPAGERQVPATGCGAHLLVEKRGSGLVPYHPVAEALFRMVSW